MSDGKRVATAAIECLLAELMAILDSPVIEVGGRAVVIFKAELIPETKRRAKEYARVGSLYSLSECKKEK